MTYRIVLEDFHLETQEQFFLQMEQTEFFEQLS